MGHGGAQGCRASPACATLDIMGEGAVGDVLRRSAVISIAGMWRRALVRKSPDNGECRPRGRDGSRPESCRSGLRRHLARHALRLPLRGAVDDAAPAESRRSMPSRIAGSLSMTSTVKCRPGRGAAERAGCCAACDRRRGRDAELRLRTRCRARLRLQADGCCQHLGNAVDDGQAEPEAGAPSPSLSRRWNSWKIMFMLCDRGFQVRCREPRCGVCRHAAGSPSAPGRSCVYLMALETRFCSTRRNSLRSDMTASAQGTTSSVEALLARRRAEFERQRLQQFVDAEGRHFRLHGAGIEPRNVEQRGEDFLDRLERGIDVARPVGILRRAACARPGSR